MVHLKPELQLHNTVYNNVTLEGKGFSKDGNVRGKKIHSIPPSVSYVNPYGDGVRMVFKNVSELLWGLLK